MKSVNIILPNYNSSNTISATIKSILRQTYKNWQLIIVDDGSNEITKNIVNMINMLILPTVTPTNMPDLSMRSLFSYVHLKVLLLFLYTK